MGEGAAERAVRCLGRGFDVASDFRPKYCKGETRVVVLGEEEICELVVPGAGVLRQVPADIKCDKGEQVRYQSDVLQFNRMSEWFNQRSGMSGKIPTGLFNAAFGFSGGCWAEDAGETKTLALDGYFISLFDLLIDRRPLILSSEVIQAVPSSWDPPALTRFIEKYGTHVIVGVSVGGQHVVYVRQDHSSSLSPSELKLNLDQLGDQLFTGTCPLPSLRFIKSFFLTDKPPLTELQHFLEFQSHRSWAPLLNDLPLGPISNRSGPTTTILQLTLIGPKLHVNTSPVTVPDRRPVTGIRLHLEGKLTNRLAIHLQHLSTIPVLFAGKSTAKPASALRWRGSDAVAAGNQSYYETVDWWRIGPVCTAPVEPDPESASVVAGAQLHVDCSGGAVLHLRLLFAEIAGSIVVRSFWDRGPRSSSTSGISGFLQRSGILSSGSSTVEREELPAGPGKVVVDSGVFEGVPPAAGAGGRLKKYVDTRERCKGPRDSPGYWVVTGAKLEVEKGRIGIHVRFSLLSSSS
ncbi:MACPF domain-containing protein CAD1 [Apostasia shenzhenica]|uniref:MACPF domain-containing protein CAD1 n=1 Tax=Apostasia shenzhenica TaxID=1088818 RepID=A0A2H9ZV49_9ASPA|nr:MACPF domain-containing protein CAD1 [Apostasia shenzhenica]